MFHPWTHCPTSKARDRFDPKRKRGCGGSAFQRFRRAPGELLGAEDSATPCSRSVGETTAGPTVLSEASRTVREWGFMTTDLIEELQTFGADFTHCALLVRVGNSTVAIFAAQVDSAISRGGVPDRKSTRLNSSHLGISYAV